MSEGAKFYLSQTAHFTESESVHLRKMSTEKRFLSFFFVFFFVFWWAAKLLGAFYNDGICSPIFS